MSLGYHNHATISRVYAKADQLEQCAKELRLLMAHTNQRQPEENVQGAIMRLEDAVRIANGAGAYLYAESFAGVANNLRAELARATEREPEENDRGQP